MQGNIDENGVETFGVDVQSRRRYLLAKFLQAMREDLAEWINSLAYDVNLSAENFISELDNGVVLCQQARLIQRYAEEYVILHSNENLKIPTKGVHYTEKGAVSGSFVARDNVANFISWCRDIGIPDVVLFESDDLVLHKNEKNVILTILDVARKALKFGVQPPEIVRFEKEIDEEIARDKENERLGIQRRRIVQMEEDNDLDTLVRNVVNRCVCSHRFPVKKLADGKYQIGKTDTIIFVRIMRKHVMVRVGGGWDILDHYVEKHDPCRMKIGGSIETNGQDTKQLSTSQANNISYTRKVSRVDGSTASSDTWSMCSSDSMGSAEGSFSSKSEISLGKCGEMCVPTPQKRRGNSKENATPNKNKSSQPEVDSSSFSLTKSIHELDEKLKLLDSKKTDDTIKDTNVYDVKEDRWLRTHMNQLKQRRMSVDEQVDDPRLAFASRRGYSDVIQSATNRKYSQQLTPNIRRRGKRDSLDYSRSSNQGLEDSPCGMLNSKYSRKKGGSHQHLSSMSAPEQTLSPNTKSISTSTQTINEYMNSGIPQLIRKPSKSFRSVSPGRSLIPRPTIQRSRTMDGSAGSVMRKRNASGQNQSSGAYRREKSCDNIPIHRRNQVAKHTPRPTKADVKKREVSCPKTKRSSGKLESAV